jgi:hypothetical protein
MPDDHIERHEIHRYFDAISAVCIKRRGDNLLGLQCDTVQGQRLLLSFEGRAAPMLKRAIDRVFARHPEMRTWK